MSETQKLTDEERAEVVVNVSASFLRDAERWQLSYTAHTATALRLRVLAAQNGRAEASRYLSEAEA